MSRARALRLSSGISDRKIGLFGLASASEDSCGVSGLVKGGSQRFDGLDCSISPAIRGIASELDRVSRRAFRICILDTLVWFLFEEGLDTLLKPTRVFLSTFEPTFGLSNGSGFLDMTAKSKVTVSQTEIDLHPDAWARFERAADVVAKSPPQHRASAVKPKATKRKSRPTKRSRKD